ncbi:MAG: LpxL/LpxP family Kdo(2)-lipid IV(A) lauroyl/palmitoleoyl acyltransferase [Gammaproteobacteria bacterium]|jgi:KDO2-lipid IV(A) lauroyltransferase|nr:LpxL/LpxP family Kdo(2)-lipid IV(A) lauroyl/palmitoleoyl acyltransferase [Gammaproteobacteria bacterium]
MSHHPYSIRYWPTWSGLGLLWCLSRLPYAWQLVIGRQLGKLFCRLSPGRRHIAETNLSLCFPELDTSAREKMLQEQFASLGIGVLEMAMSWWGTDRQLRKLARLEGLEHLHRALDRGKGVILLSGHFTTLEIGGRLLSMVAPFHVMYRSHKNVAFENMLKTARTRHFKKAIPRGDLRGMLKSLRDNVPVWYAPDQDYGREQSIFVPFFGISTASVTGTSRLARISQAAVVPFFQTRLPGAQGYQLTLYPALENFPGESVEADTRRINALIEARVREQPEQYLWVHRRFKTRPEGEAGVYD